MFSIKIASCFAYDLTPLCLHLAGQPGIVNATITRESGECLGETLFRYKNPKKKGNNQGLSNKRKLDELSAIVKDFAKKLKQFQQGDDGDESLKSAFKQGN